MESGCVMSWNDFKFDEDSSIVIIEAMDRLLYEIRGMRKIFDRWAVANMYQMGIESLPPEHFEKLVCIIDAIEENRRIK